MSEQAALLMPKALELRRHELLSLPPMLRLMAPFWGELESLSDNSTSA